MTGAGGLRGVCVYLGSSPGADPVFMEAAAGFGRLLARRGCRLVYGGVGGGAPRQVAGPVPALRPPR